MLLTCLAALLNEAIVFSLTLWCLGNKHKATVSK